MGPLAPIEGANLKTRVIGIPYHYITAFVGSRIRPANPPFADYSETYTKLFHEENPRYFIE
jgi:hypothetical protein